MPAVARLMEHRRRALDVETVRPWDTQVELETTRPVKPFDDLTGFVEPAKRVFHALDPELGAQFHRMADEGLLDLVSRPGKAPGGYCTKLPWRGVPFIFMNAVGVPDDVNTLVHEAGHSFHDFAAHRQPFIWQRGVTHEAAELASMSMELLVTPHLERPTGYYSPEEARSAYIERLEDILLSLAHIASVDAFQAWIYTSGQGVMTRRVTRRGSRSARGSSAASTGRDWSVSVWRAGTANSTSSSTRSTTSSTGSRSLARSSCGARARTIRGDARAVQIGAGARRDAAAAGDLSRGRCSPDLRRGWDGRVGGGGGSADRDPAGGGGPDGVAGSRHVGAVAGLWERGPAGSAGRGPAGCAGAGVILTRGSHVTSGCRGPARARATDVPA